MGPIVFERIEGSINDGAFFGPFLLDGKEWRGFFRFSNNTIELDQFKSARSKTISIKEFQVI